MNRPDLSLPDSKHSESSDRVSVVLPTFEPDVQYLVQSIQSVAHQTYDSVELILIDSTDLDWLRALGEEYSWIIYRYQKPSGLPAAWNAGIEAATGTYITFLSDDDYYTTDKISKQVEWLHRGYDIVYSDEYVINNDGTETYLSSLPVTDQHRHHITYFIAGQGVPHITVMGRTECFRSESFDERLDVREDPHLWVRLFKRYEVAKIDDALVYKRRREESATGDPELLYENELREIELLCEALPELADYRPERERMANYRYAKHLLRIGRISESRSIFVNLLRDGMVESRVIGLLVVSLLPVGNRTAFQWLETVAERRKR